MKQEIRENLSTNGKYVRRQSKDGKNNQDSCSIMGLCEGHKCCKCTIQRCAEPRKVYAHKLHNVMSMPRHIEIASDEQYRAQPKQEPVAQTYPAMGIVHEAL